MEESIEDLLARYDQVPVNGKIDLGWENGWGKKTVELYYALLKRNTHSHTRSGNASNQSKSFIVEENGVQYKVLSQLDSGD
jgi:hypothetical protein